MSQTPKPSQEVIDLEELINPEAEQSRFAMAPMECGVAIRSGQVVRSNVAEPFTEVSAPTMLTQSRFGAHGGAGSSVIDFPDEEWGGHLPAALVAKGWTQEGPDVFKADVEICDGQVWPVWVQLYDSQALMLTPLVSNADELVLSWYQEKLGDAPEFQLRVRAGVICLERYVVLPDSLIITAYAQPLARTLLGDSIRDRAFLDDWSPFGG